MPSTTLIVSGMSVLDNPHVNTNSSGGGHIMIHGGTSVFQPDDIIVVQVDNATSALEVNGQSRIVGIKVYDSAADYLNNNVKFTYNPMNPGQYANIQSDVSGLGDTYLRFNANVLVSSDAGAPQLSQLVMAPGYDLTDIKGKPITISRYTSVDYDGSGGIDSGTTEEQNGLFATENNMFTPICLTRGTRIDTPFGPVAVEDLRIGDLVSTLDAGPQPIRWIGSRRIDGRGKHAPIRIRAQVLGNIRDLLVSPNHRMMVSGPHAELLFGETQVLVAAKHLVNGRTIRAEPCAFVDYFHFLCDEHQIVFAEACPTESLFPGREALNGVTDDARSEILDLFPELAGIAHIGRLSRYELTRYEAQVWKQAC